MNLKNISLTVGIAVLFSLFIGFAIDAFYSEPDYNTYCKNQFVNKFPYAEPSNRTACPPINYQEPVYQDCPQDKGYVAYETDQNGCQVKPYCETCQVAYDAANKIYSRNLFFIAAIIGIIAILAGLIFIKNDSIASGFMFGGILLIIYGTVRVFGDLSKVMRVIVLFIELVLLVYIGIKKTKKK
ncbi:MAG TPA: hypothetical protein VJB87_05535 [Candidatus Nanoarchaeia archaeon]|nr:hypothetical protein [Candidatus Nanoarchaeia archaeon]